MINDDDTIIAPATAVNESGLAVIRISGKSALLFLNKFFRPAVRSKEMKSHQLYLGHIVDHDQSVVDEVMAVYMASPHSYTTESVAEVHCHGSRQVVRRIIDLAGLLGIRIAQPGEFTYRAYLNGRIDLVQAEAVSRLIQSTSELSRKSALQQLEGHLSRELYRYAHTIKQLLVQIEAWIDFPEEDLPEESIGKISLSAIGIYDAMVNLMASYRTGQHVHEGAIVALAGLPNAGKSSLMNALLKQDRSIVSDIPGTTRDLIEQSTQISGIKVRLVDTAGLRHSDDFIEQEGVRRARNILTTADIILLIMDGSVPVSDLFIDLLAEFSGLQVVLVINKSDLCLVQDDVHFFSGPIVRLSAKYGEGLQDLVDMISSLLLQDHLSSSESPYITERRHYETLLTASQHLNSFIKNVGLVDLDLLSIDLRAALDSLGQITGVITTDDLLNDVFSSFCIGK
ncbi:tRNA uridine-5-carboxymethylaminomethyl(34) synthesis GTPase MnmE [Pelovirga terrestris]|uniref:tRNA modification GTPase MnmE n=1 Tax=Pelovirga terrestris TaxID=2771352 RepID=A0A8J6R522_9BACT|nr:tRNA uridine-5-carboxymethylaminomethyl(34) synthesis GTPase MnmE [Pelovirga terrestris]MBD1399879.1 tRNA uridine-5-carboxymethylaminomethyl(34) synthesis GTPase MnmE [Pelovirga terrestris]